MGIFGKRKMKCARCHNTLHDYSEEYVRNAAPAILGLALRNSMHVTCSTCRRNYCVRCMETDGTYLSDLGRHRLNEPLFVVLWCTSSRERMMDTDLPAAHPALKSMMMQAYPDLKAGQLEALTRLTHQPLGEATYAIRGFMSDKDFLELVEKMKTIDEGLANYLQRRSPPRIQVGQLTFPGHQIGG